MMNMAVGADIGVAAPLLLPRMLDIPMRARSRVWGIPNPDIAIPVEVAAVSRQRLLVFPGRDVGMRAGTWQV